MQKTQPGVVLAFQTLDALRLVGPVDVREMLKRRQTGHQFGRAAVVVQFRPAHAAVLSREG